MVKNTVLLVVLLCTFANITNAQDYYPVDIGNTWVLESTDGTERITYTIEATDELFNGAQVRILEITTEVLGTSRVTTSTFHVEVAEEGMKLHKIVTELGDVFGVAHVEFSSPAVFFPPTLQLGERWETQGETDTGSAADGREAGPGADDWY